MKFNALDINKKHRNQNEEENYSKNPQFFQFYKKKFPHITQLISDHPKAARFFFFIIQNMDDNNALIISQVAIKEALGIGRTTTWLLTNYLKENKYLNVQKTGTSNAYLVNCQLIWQKSNNLKKFAKFNATVYISGSEQYGEIEKIAYFTPKLNNKKIKPNNNFYNE